MVKYRDTIGGEPHVGFKTGGAELYRQLERIHRVLGGMRTGPAVSKEHRGLQDRRQSLLHAATLRSTPAQARRLAGVFNLSGTEIVFIAILGLIVLGPEKLPGAMRRVGKIYREIRNISGNVQREVQKVMDEPMRQVRSLVEEPANELKKSAQSANDIFAGKMPHLEQRLPAQATPSETTNTETTKPDQPTAPQLDAPTDSDHQQG
jgi:Tat protein translocase TatB subunit